jgi:hypothetical protein
MGLVCVFEKKKTTNKFSYKYFIGMNVKVPGKDYDNLFYFYWIILSLAVFAILSLTLAKKLKLI